MGQTGGGNRHRARHKDKTQIDVDRFAVGRIMHQANTTIYLYSTHICPSSKPVILLKLSFASLGDRRALRIETNQKDSGSYRPLAAAVATDMIYDRGNSIHR